MFVRKLDRHWVSPSGTAGRQFTVNFSYCLFVPPTGVGPQLWVLIFFRPAWSDFVFESGKPCSDLFYCLDKDRNMTDKSVSVCEKCHTKV